MTEKVIRVIFILSFLICTTPRWILAQGTLNALDVSLGTTVVGNRPSGGIGWAFVPTTDLLVTGISSTAPQVDFWLGTNQNIASYYYGGPYYSGGGHIFDSGYPTNFQSISNVLLSAGQTYFISTQNTNSLEISLFTYSLNGTNGLAPFNISPYISQFASYYLSTNGQWSSTTTPSSENVNYALIGPNFQFEPIPEPMSGRIIFMAAAILTCFRMKWIDRA